MSDFLARTAERALGQAQGLAPVRPSRYELMLEPQVAEHQAAAPPPPRPARRPADPAEPSAGRAPERRALADEPPPIVDAPEAPPAVDAPEAPPAVEAVPEPSRSRDGATLPGPPRRPSRRRAATLPEAVAEPAGAAAQRTEPKLRRGRTAPDPIEPEAASPPPEVAATEPVVERPFRRSTPSVEPEAETPPVVDVPAPLPGSPVTPALRPAREPRAEIRRRAGHAPAQAPPASVSDRARRGRSSPGEEPINIRIDRVEVRAPAAPVPAPPPAPPSPRVPALSLDDYLRTRGGLER